VAEPAKPFFLKRSRFFSFVRSDEHKRTATNEFFFGTPEPANAERRRHDENSKKAKTMKENQFMKKRTQLTKIILLLAVLLALGAARTRAQNQMIGINVLLNQPVTDSILQDLGRHGQVLDVISQINGVTLRARSSELSTIQTLSYVTGANPDTEGYAESDFSAGTNLFNLDAVNVTNFGTTPPRVVDYDGDGVYIGVIDTGLPFNWREYFPEERIAVEFAAGFGGGGGLRGTISSQPETWERDTFGHGIAVTSVILGFSYNLSDPPLPATFNGVAPKATVIPVDVFPGEHNSNYDSVVARAIVYMTDLKIDGHLGTSPFVINMSLGGFVDDVLERAAIDYAIAHGVVIVASAGNSADGGMVFPGRYAPVISAGATGWLGEFPPDDPTHIEWILNDVAEGDLSQHGIPPFSSWELPGQDLDVLAPGNAVPAAGSVRGGIGLVDYCFVTGTSFACPHVAGIAALMLQKNPGLTAAEIEEILENTAFPLPPGCGNVIVDVHGPGHWWSWRWVDFANVSFIQIFGACWDASQTGHGLVQADGALAATPLP
jgi:subtilisin family serine protease